GSPRCSRRETTRAPPRTCSRATCSGEARAPERGARRAGRRLRRRRLCAAGDDGAAAAAEAVPDRVPRGLHARADGRAREGGGEDRRARAAPPGAPERGRLPRGEPPRRRAVLRTAAAGEPRGLPLPGHLRLPAPDAVAAARRRPARGLLPQL